MQRNNTNTYINYNEKTSSLSLLNDLPKEIRQEEIYLRSPLGVLGLLAQTSKQYEAETASSRLMAATINAAPEFLDAKESPTALASIALLKKHPDLLFIKKRITDHYGREMLASPYQIFLGAGDIWALKQVQEEVIPKIENGKAQADVQFKEQFPNYDKKLDHGIDDEERFYDDRNKRQIEEIVKQLKLVEQCIAADSFTNNQPNDATKQTIEALCNLFKPKPGEVIRSGLHFPLAIMKEIYKTYNALHDHFSFFTLAVIKPALDALSTVDGQCCQGGFSTLDMEKGPNRRCDPAYKHPLGKPLDLTLVNDKEKRGAAAVVDPYDGDILFASSTRGYFDCYNKNAVGYGCCFGGLCGWSGGGFGKLLENKSRVYGDLLCSYTQRSQHTISMTMSNR